MPFPTEKKLEEMIRVAMQDSAPQLYARLMKNQELSEFARMRASSATQQFNEQMSLVSPADMRLVLSAQSEGYSQTVQAWTMRQKRIEESVLAQALEFPTETQAETISPLLVD